MEYFYKTLVILVLSSCVSRGPKLAAQTPIFHKEFNNPNVIGFIGPNNTYWEKNKNNQFIATNNPPAANKRIPASLNPTLPLVPTKFGENGILLSE